MRTKVHAVVLLICAGLVMMLALCFFSRVDPIKADVPLVTKENMEEYQTQVHHDQQQREQAALARKRAELAVKMHQCQSNDDCIIVDQDPCGCLKGPQGVTSINAAYSLEFSELMAKQFAKTTTCPSEGSTVRECSASARAACQNKRCKIVY